jgi:Spy/CpxP family protein refolding chaperone
MALVVGLMSMGVITGAEGSAQQEPPAPTNPPNEGAPGRGAGGGNVENRLQNLSKELNLTDAQIEKIRPILKHEVERIKEVRNNTSLSQAEARQRMATIRRNTRQHIAEILTPEQKKQWREMQQERRGGGPEGGQGRPGGPGGPGGQGGPGSQGGPGGPDAPAGPQNPPNPQ